LTKRGGSSATWHNIPETIKENSLVVKTQKHIQSKILLQEI